MDCLCARSHRPCTCDNKYLSLFLEYSSLRPPPVVEYLHVRIKTTFICEKILLNFFVKERHGKTEILKILAASLAGVIFIIVIGIFLFKTSTCCKNIGKFSNYSLPQQIKSRQCDACELTSMVTELYKESSRARTGDPRINGDIMANVNRVNHKFFWAVARTFIESGYIYAFVLCPTDFFESNCSYPCVPCEL